jgi:hypothetical protein
MKIMRLVTLICLCVFGAILPNARADEWDKKTVVTFSGPVEIPGQVLSAGTYVFKLADSQSDRNIVQVFDKDETHLYGTFLAIPDYWLEPPDKPVITFEERAFGSPEAIKAWFYPGDNYGRDFVYPKAKAVELAKRTNQNVPSMPSALGANTTQPAKTMSEPHVTAMKKAPIKVEKPSGEEVEVAQAIKTTPTAPAPAPQPVTRTASVTKPKQLPQTASPLPLLGLIGVLSIIAGLSVRATQERTR